MTTLFSLFSWNHSTEQAVLFRGAGKKVFYGGTAECLAKDLIAKRCIVQSGVVATKATDPATGQPLRMSEKPVTLCEYFITSLVRTVCWLYSCAILKSAICISSM